MKEKMKISKFCFGKDLSDTVECLAKQGMVMAALGILGGAIHIALTFLIDLKFCNECNALIMKGAAFSHLAIHPGLFLYSYILYKKNTKSDVLAVKKMMKIGCYVTGSLQVAVFATILLTGIFLLICSLFLFYGSFYLAITLVASGGILLIFPFLLLNGIQTSNPKKIKSWIIFQSVMLVFGVSFGWVSFYLLDTFFLWTALQLIGGVLIFLYTSGVLVIVHYNIVIEEQQVQESAPQIFSIHEAYGDGMDFKQTDLPPAYSQIDPPPPYSHVV